jgi:hypothetical protein
MPGFPFTATEPNQIGQVTKWDVPVNDWLGLKFSSGHADTLGTAIERWAEEPWFDDNKVRPDLLNRVYGIDGHLTFDKPEPIQRARLMHERKRAELERLAYLESASHSWHSAKAAVGFGAALVGGISHPVDLGLSFLPFIGSEKAAASVAKLGGASWRQALQRGVIAEEAMLGKVPYHRLTASVIDGTVNQAVMEIPIAIQKHRDKAIYGIEDSVFNIVAGGAFAGAVKGLGLALERAGMLWREADPRMREAVIQDTVNTILTGESPKAHWAMGMDEAAIRAKVGEDVRARNPVTEEFKPEIKRSEPEPDLERIKYEERTGELAQHGSHVRANDDGSLTVSDDVIQPGDPIHFGFMGGPSDMPKPWVLVEAGNKFSTVNYKLNPWATVMASDGTVKTYQNAHHYSPHRFNPDRLDSERQASVESFFSKSKADHEAKLQGLIDDETRKVMDEVRRSQPSPDPELVKGHSIKHVPDDANIKAVEEDSADFEQTVLNMANTPEARVRLEAEIKAELKALDEQGVSGEKAIDSMIPCVVAKSK